MKYRRTETVVAIDELGVERGHVTGDGVNNYHVFILNGELNKYIGTVTRLTNGENILRAMLENGMEIVGE